MKENSNCLIEGLCFLGIGDYLYIFNGKTRQYQQKLQIFEGRNIYGIVPYNLKCIVFSGKYLKIIHTDEEFQNITKETQQTYSDWILDAKWTNNGETFVTVSMHNKFQIWNSLLCLECEKECEDKCMLYSAHIYIQQENIMIFAGTVFSEILVWNGRNSVNDKCQVMKRLQGHKVSYDFS